VLHVECSDHNHRPSKRMSGHPSARRLTEEEIEIVHNMSMSGSRPRAILASLVRANPNTLATSKDIYNAKLKFQRAYLAGRTPIQALVDELRTGSFEFDLDQDPQQRVTRLFFAHQHSINLARIYSTVVLMDCTYRTNRYRMPLLHVVGTTGFNTTFSIAFVFLSGETEADYLWALARVNGIFVEHPRVIVTDRDNALGKAIERVFPGAAHLLCVWHIEKNVLAKCKRAFETDEEWQKFMKQWAAVTLAKSEVEYHQTWLDLCIGPNSTGC